MKNILDQFKLNGKTVYCEPYGNGHINVTYLVKTDLGSDYILQQINKNVFKDPDAVMQNIAMVTDFLSAHSYNPRSVMQLIRTVDDKISFIDEENETWRVYDLVPNTITLEMVEFPIDFFGSLCYNDTKTIEIEILNFSEEDKYVI